MTNDKKICKIEPKRAIVYENGSPIVYVKPCNVKYTDKHEVHCKKWEERTCEYMALEHVKRQQSLDDVITGC
jgi:hypothetical protein